jgi:hypothetical protein
VRLCINQFCTGLKWVSYSVTQSYNPIAQKIDIVLNWLINSTHHLPCFAWLVLMVAAVKTHFEEQALEAGTKQSKTKQPG